MVQAKVALGRAIATAAVERVENGQPGVEGETLALRYARAAPPNRPSHARALSLDV
jgi:hypothetical protein